MARSLLPPVCKASYIYLPCVKSWNVAFYKKGNSPNSLEFSYCEQTIVLVSNAVYFPGSKQRKMKFVAGSLFSSVLGYWFAAVHLSLSEQNFPFPGPYSLRKIDVKTQSVGRKSVCFTVESELIQKIYKICSLFGSGLCGLIMWGHIQNIPS